MVTTAMLNRKSKSVASEPRRNPTSAGGGFSVTTRLPIQTNEADVTGGHLAADCASAKLPAAWFA